MLILRGSWESDDLETVNAYKVPMHVQIEAGAM